ncbi:hypothetical protein SRS16CHR_04128 [Variovorax sp. SRS16]|uniref:hypothetical protein n=1 Tax=Variovorax sp. SRS16 TaxID=282217 RepID=UPI0013161500|nr:hypothetical protein [Variovorax sp. SRS16]VTU27748.1 hypothetical protein SRS16CHR_04128 [Variovorax sp. SRS16]
MGLADLQCLALRERGAERHPLDRALLLAAAAAPEIAWADRPLGARDAALLTLRCEWFGAAFEAQVGCPACGEALTFTLDLNDFAQRAPRDEAPVTVGAARFRRPTSRDLAALVDAVDVDAAAQRLLERLALDGVRAWSAEERTAIEAALDAADPLAHVTLDLACTYCAHPWSAPLDIAASLWDELAAQADRLLDDVHLLAGAYGWSESEILALPPARRQRYIERVLS